jgi:hypothetical protein
MYRINILIKWALCMALLAHSLPVVGAVKEVIPNIEALWQKYKHREADILPAVRYPYDHCFRSAAREYDLPLSLLLAVARGESYFNPRAQSNRNCHGVMQIQWPGTANHLGVFRLSALYEPCTNIRAGARYLKELSDRYDGNIHLALAAYNYGPGRIKKQAGANRIPHGAKWYSGYIYHHMRYILRDTGSNGTNGAGAPDASALKKRLALITFNQPYRADAYYQHLQKKDPSLELDLYHIGLGRYQVVMLYADHKSLESGRKKLKKLGVLTKAR